MTLQSVEQPEFSRPTPISSIGGDDLAFSITAKTAELAALATRLGVESVENLAASGILHKESKGRLRLRGQVQANLRQISVVTLEEISTAVQEDFNVLLCRENDPLLLAADSDDENFALDEDIDLLEGDTIDLGEQAVQIVSLAVSPYPREDASAPIAEIPQFTEIAAVADGRVSFDMPDHIEATEDKENPFKALKNLRQ